jgi:hypothetical protein
MPRLPTLKAIPLEGDPISREVRLLAVQGRRHSPALDAFVKVARLRDWSVKVPHRGMPARNGPGDGERSRMTTTRTPLAKRFQPIDPQSDALPVLNHTDRTLA